MAFGVLGPWLDQTAASATKLNGMMRISGTGADLSTLSPSVHKFLYCTATGSGFTVEHNYKANAAGDAYLDENTGQTTSGGSGATVSYTTTIMTNSKVIDTGAWLNMDMEKAKFSESVSGTGAITDDLDGTTGEMSVKLATGATPGGRSAITSVGLKQDFSKRSFLQFKSKLTTLSSLNLRGGVNSDLVTSADSNVVSYSAEICTATNNNWFVRSATTGANTASSTGIAATTNRVGIKLEHYPDLGTPSVLMYIDAAAAVQKTTNVASSGTGTNNNVIRFSVKNSTTADRPWFIYGTRLVYQVLDSWV